MSMLLSLLMAAQAGSQATSLQSSSPEMTEVQERARREAAAKQAGQEKSQPQPEVKAEEKASETTAHLPVPPEYAEKFQACIDTARDNPDEGLQFASKWLTDGGSFYARQCQGFAMARGERWGAAQAALEQAADEADLKHDVAAGRLWAQAGNAALAAGNFAKARTSFDAAIARGLPDGIDKGEAYLDRARAAVALGDNPAARSDLDRAIAQVPADPLAWLLSATLARRMGNLALAEKHISEAARLSSDDIAVALEQGNIAKMNGKDEDARDAWTRAVKLGANRAEGKAAAANLDELANLAELAKTPAPKLPANP